VKNVQNKLKENLKKELPWLPILGKWIKDEREDVSNESK
jgi:hypothetical protein